MSTHSHLTHPRAEEVTAIVLAAGAGTRMKSARAKVLHEIAGRSMIEHALTAVAGAGVRATVAVVGHDRDQVTEAIAAHDPAIVIAVQEEQNGTGHAVRVALQSLDRLPSGTVLVTYGDVPLLSAETLSALLADHHEAGRAVTILTSEVDDPTGYGRIVRDDAGSVTAIREHKDASEQERAIREINSGILVVEAEFLAHAVVRAGGQQRPRRAVPDRHRRAGGRSRGAPSAPTSSRTSGRPRASTTGPSSPASAASSTGGSRRTGWPKVSRSSTPPRPGSTRPSRWPATSPCCRAPSCSVPRPSDRGPRSAPTPRCATSRSATARPSYAPTAATRSSRPTRRSARSRTCVPGPSSGKAARSAPSSRSRTPRSGPAPRCRTCRTSATPTIGEGTNIGAGTIFANYDGVNKNRTTVGRHARTASNNTFVAPVVIGDGAHTGAGTTVRHDIPAGALAVPTNRQRNIEGWVADKRPGSASDQAAREAQNASKLEASGE